jgi:cytochrome c553
VQGEGLLSQLAAAAVLGLEPDLPQQAQTADTSWNLIEYFHKVLRQPELTTNRNRIANNNTHEHTQRNNEGGAMVRKVFIAMCFISVSSFGQLVHAATPTGQMLAYTCVGCHGNKGVSEGAIPSIDNLSAEQMAQAMQDYKSDKRPGTIMNRIAKGYTEEEIKAMADYFASLKK